MPKRVSIEPKLSLSELEEKYRKAKDAVERSHWQVVWLLAQGKTTNEVADVTGYSVGWICQIAGRYNKTGTLGDRRGNNPGAKPLLSQKQQLELWEALQTQAPDGGLWNGPKVAQWMTENTGQDVYAQRGWEYLRDLGFSLQSPRPKHAKGNVEDQEEFKKNSQRKSVK
jgi:transposase